MPIKIFAMKTTINEDKKELKKNFCQQHGLNIFVTVAIFTAWIILYACGLHGSALEASYAADVAQSELSPGGSLNNWQLYSVIVGKQTASATSSQLAATGYWDPADHINFATNPPTYMFEDPAKYYAGSTFSGFQPLKLELTITDLFPAPTGGTVKINWNVIPPYDLLNHNVYPKRLIDGLSLTFVMDTQSFDITPNSKGFSGTVTLKLQQGSLLMAPYDNYKDSIPTYCVWTYAPKANPSGPTTGFFNFLVKWDASNVGDFHHQTDYYPYWSNGLTGADLQENMPGFTIWFHRTPMSIVFAQYMIIGMWLIALGGLFAMLPFYYGTKKFDSAPVALVGGSVFALTGYRNNFPGKVPLGAVIDFASFYWCSVIITINFLIGGFRQFLYIQTAPPPKDDKKKDDKKAEEDAKAEKKDEENKKPEEVKKEEKK